MNATGRRSATARLGQPEQATTENEALTVVVHPPTAQPDAENYPLSRSRRPCLRRVAFDAPLLSRQSVYRGPGPPDRRFSVSNRCKTHRCCRDSPFTGVLGRATGVFPVSNRCKTHRSYRDTTFTRISDRPTAVFRPRTRTKHPTKPLIHTRVFRLPPRHALAQVPFVQS